MKIKTYYEIYGEDFVGDINALISAKIKGQASKEAVKAYIMYLIKPDIGFTEQLKEVLENEFPEYLNFFKTIIIMS